MTVAFKRSPIVLPIAVALFGSMVAPVWADMKPPDRADIKRLKTTQSQTPLDHNNLGVRLGMAGQWTQAFKEHELAIKGEPANKTFKTNYSSALLRHGDELYKQGKYKEAIPVLKKALEIDSANKPAAEILAKAEAESKSKAPSQSPAPDKAATKSSAK